MEASKRRTALLYGLRRTRENLVHVDTTHLIEALGLEGAEKLVKNMTAMISATRPAYSTREVVVRNGYCAVVREECILELEKKNVQEAKSAIDRRMGR